MSYPIPRQAALDLLRRGVVIPAAPLALDEERRFDVRHQRALMRYYYAAGAGGVAVGVHTTQFEIRDPQIGLYEPVLRVCAGVLDEVVANGTDPIVKIAGVCGSTAQACGEAALAMNLGYDAVLLSLGGWSEASVGDLLRHCHEVARVAPLVGFYLQPAVGGRDLPYEFWREFVEIPNVVAIKIAPFDRYRTLAVVRAVADAQRAEEIALYTGNDDHIVDDLITPFAVGEHRERALFIKGGLLGQFSVWTRTAVRLLQEIHECVIPSRPIPLELLERGAQLTDANAAIFDAAHGFKGCIPGINEVLRQQGLLATRYCLDRDAELSPGQAEEIARVRRQYAWLPDDDFVAAHLAEWLD